MPEISPIKNELIGTQNDSKVSKAEKEDSMMEASKHESLIEIQPSD